MLYLFLLLLLIVVRDVYIPDFLADILVAFIFLITILTAGRAENVFGADLLRQGWTFHALCRPGRAEFFSGLRGPGRASAGYGLAWLGCEILDKGQL